MLRLSWGCSLFAPLSLGRCFGHGRNGNSIAGSGTREYLDGFSTLGSAGMVREPQQRRGVHKLQANQCRASPAGWSFISLFRDVKTKIYKQMFGIAPTRRPA